MERKKVPRAAVPLGLLALGCLYMALVAPMRFDRAPVLTGLVARVDDTPVAAREGSRDILPLPRIDLELCLTVVDQPERIAAMALEPNSDPSPVPSVSRSTDTVCLNLDGFDFREAWAGKLSVRSVVRGWWAGMHVPVPAYS